MNRRLKRVILGTALVGLATVAGIYFTRDHSKKGERIMGEVTRDFIQETPMGRLYRIFVETDNEEVTYPVLASPQELVSLVDNYMSREDTGKRGDIIAINPKSIIISLDERVLLPSDITVIEKTKDNKIEYNLSNGMNIPNWRIIGIESFETGRKYRIGEDYGEMEVFDLGDGRPFVWQDDFGDPSTRKKRFNLTYKFCDVPGHGPYPIWEPTAFRSDPCYGLK